MPWKDTQRSRLRRLFLEGFSAMDVAEPLVSFDVQAKAVDVQRFMLDKNYDIVGVRSDGLVDGYVRREDLTSGSCGSHMRPFLAADDLIPDSSNLIDVVKSLAINQRCFVTILDQVGAIVTLADLEKPPMRMFLFGMITIIEMTMTEILRQRYPNDSWQELLSDKRVALAKKLKEERVRRGQPVELLDCLQFGDKGWIITYDDELRQSLGHKSRRETRTAIKEFENLRNNLAHTQEIIPSGWQRIVVACSRWESSLDLTVEHFVPEKKMIQV
jgi:hypothetical protein